MNRHRLAVEILEIIRTMPPEKCPQPKVRHSLPSSLSNQHSHGQYTAIAFRTANAMKRSHEAEVPFQPETNTSRAPVGAKRAPGAGHRITRRPLPPDCTALCGDAIHIAVGQTEEVPCLYVL